MKYMKKEKRRLGPKARQELVALKGPAPLARCGLAEPAPFFRVFRVTSGYFLRALRKFFGRSDPLSAAEPATPLVQLLQS
jgi:hypothetical protein